MSQPQETFFQGEDARRGGAQQPQFPQQKSQSVEVIPFPWEKSQVGKGQEHISVDEQH